MEPEKLSPEAEEASRIAVHAQKNAAQAVEMARAAQMQAHDEITTKALATALREVFGEQEESQRFIDTKRIPLICKDISEMRGNISDIKEMFIAADKRYVNQDQFSPVQKLVYGVVALILTAVMGALIALVVIR